MNRPLVRSTSALTGTECRELAGPRASSSCGGCIYKTRVLTPFINDASHRNRNRSSRAAFHKTQLAKSGDAAAGANAMSTYQHQQAPKNAFSFLPAFAFWAALLGVGGLLLPLPLGLRVNVLRRAVFSKKQRCRLPLPEALLHQQTRARQTRCRTRPSRLTGSSDFNVSTIYI